MEQIRITGIGGTGKSGSQGSGEQAQGKHMNQQTLGGNTGFNTQE